MIFIFTVAFLCGAWLSLGCRGLKSLLWPEARYGEEGCAMLRIKVHGSQTFRELQPALLESVAAVRQGAETELCFLFMQGKFGLTCTPEVTKKKSKATVGEEDSAEWLFSSSVTSP